MITIEFLGRKKKMFLDALDSNQQELQSVEIVGQLTHFYTYANALLPQSSVSVSDTEFKKNLFNYER